MRFLLVPGNNSLSHAAKCLALERELSSRGHEALIAVSEPSSWFLKRLGVRHEVLPDIQENDHAGLPTVEWFRDTERIASCVRAETALLEQYRPDRAVGVFRFTLKASAAMAGVPFDSLLCGCMLPTAPVVLGYAGGEPDRPSQQLILDGFFQYAGLQATRAFAPFGIGRCSDVRELLAGERTFLWDIPEFNGLPPVPGTVVAGPITWGDWPHDRLDVPALVRKGKPIALVSFGTCASHTSVAARIVRILVGLGYHVVLAAGGQRTFLGIENGNGSVTVCSFAPLHDLFPHASLLVTHGGQMTVFEALQNEVPVAVVPFQPEQAHNGVCLERIGCGRRLVPSRCFQGNASAYVDAFDGRSDADIAGDISALVNDPGLPARLSAMRTALAKYSGPAAIAAGLEEP